MEQKNLIAEGKNGLFTQIPLEQPYLELPPLITLPEKIFLTRKFNPTFCTCDKHCSHEPQYHMERTVFRLDQLSVPTSAGDLEVFIKEKLKAANFIIESTEVEGEDKAELFHNKKTEFVKELVARMRDEDVHRLQDYFGKEGRITLTGFDGVLLCRQRKMPSKANSVKKISQKAVSHKAVSVKVTAQLYQAKETAEERMEIGQKAVRKQKDIDKNKEYKSVRLLEKTDFNKEMAGIVQAYEFEYKESKENDKESVAKRIDVTDAFDSDFTHEINCVIKELKSQLPANDTEVGYVPSTVVHGDVFASDILTSENKDQTDVSCLSSKLIVASDVTCDFSHQMKGIVRAYEAEYAEAEEIHDKTTDNIIDTFEPYHGQDDFAPEPDYFLPGFNEGDNTEDNKMDVEISKAESKSPLDNGRQEAEADIFAERITPLVKESTAFHSANGIYAEISDIVRVYESEVEEAKEIYKRMLSGTLDTDDDDDDREYEATLKHAFVINATKTATSVAKEAMVDDDCSVNRLNETSKAPEASNTDKSMYKHTVFQGRHDLDEGLEKFSETVVSTILEHISESDKMTDKNVYGHSIFHRRHDFDEGLEKLSESVVSKILEQIIKSDKMKSPQDSHLYQNEFVNGTDGAERNSGAPNGLISDSKLAVIRNVEATDVEKYDEECRWIPPDIEREEPEAAAAHVVINASFSSEIGIECSASSTPDTQEADALKNLPQADIENAEGTEDDSDDECTEDLRHFTTVAAPNNLPVIAYYDDDDDNGLSPCFGILAVYCESEIHASWGETDQGSIQTVRD